MYVCSGAVWSHAVPHYSRRPLALSRLLWRLGVKLWRTTAKFCYFPQEQEHRRKQVSSHTYSPSPVKAAAALALDARMVWNNSSWNPGATGNVHRDQLLQSSWAAALIRFDSSNPLLMWRHGKITDTHRAKFWNKELRKIKLNPWRRADWEHLRQTESVSLVSDCILVSRYISGFF